jgi:hypothetical protein
MVKTKWVSAIEPRTGPAHVDVQKKDKKPAQLGRPSVVTPEIRQKMFRLARTMSRLEISRALGLSRSTVDRHIGTI